MFWKFPMEQPFQQHSLAVKLLQQPGVIKQQGADSSMKTALISCVSVKDSPLLGGGTSMCSLARDILQSHISGAAALLSAPFSSWKINPQSTLDLFISNGLLWVPWGQHTKSSAWHDVTTGTLESSWCINLSTHNIFSLHSCLLLSGDNSQCIQLRITLTSKTRLSPQYLETIGTRISREDRV